jgi:hypothetical protein
LLHESGARESERWHAPGLAPGDVTPSSLLLQESGASESERWHALGVGPQRH